MRRSITRMPIALYTAKASRCKNIEKKNETLMMRNILGIKHWEIELYRKPESIFYSQYYVYQFNCGCLTQLVAVRLLPTWKQKVLN